MYSEENVSKPEARQGQQEEFDIVWLAAYLWGKRKAIAYATVGAVALSVLLYFVRPKVFTAEAAILPVMEAQGADMSNVKGLAAMVGINLGSGGASGTLITPDLYTEVVTSTPALLEIMETVPLTWAEPEDTVMTLYEHMRADSVLSVGGAILKYTVRLPWTIKEAMSAPPAALEFSAPKADDQTQIPRPTVLDKVRRKCAEWLRDRIVVTPDKETNLVRISAQGETPEQSAELATAVMRQIQNTITEYATSSTKRTLDFLQERYDETMQEFTVSRREFYDYRDRNRNVIEERSDVTRQQLEDKYNMSYNLLQTLQSELEKSRLKLLAETPIFSVVEPVVQPEKKSSPKMLLHLFGGFFVGMIFSVGGLLVWLGYKQVFAPREFKVIYDKYRVEDEA